MSASQVALTFIQIILLLHDLLSAIVIEVRDIHIIDVTFLSVCLHSRVGGRVGARERAC